MGYLKAKVQNGRLRLDVPSTLPDGSVVELEVVAVSAGSEPAPDSHGAFDEAEADTAVGPLLTEEPSFSSAAKSSS